MTFMSRPLLGCPEIVPLPQLRQHVSSCTFARGTHPPTLKRVVTESTPVKAILTASPSKLQGKTTDTLLAHLVDAKSSGGSLELHTGGRSKLFCQVTQGNKSSNDASSRTLQRRQKELTRLSSTVCGSSESAVAQHAASLKCMNKTDRDQLLSDAGLAVKSASPGAGLALKTDLHLTWHSMRKLRRWFKEFGIVLESEKSMRKLVQDELPFSITCEKVPMVDKHGVVFLTPMLVIPDLITLVLSYLSSYRKADLLFWHDGAIKQNEILVKIGGDHGGNSFKLCFQIANVRNPNSLECTIPFCIFEAKDTPANLATAFSVFYDQIVTLNGMAWEEHTIHVTLFGDYEFQTSTYGLSGSSGVRPCLHCHTTKKDFQTEKQKRAVSTPRTLQTLREDLTKYQQDGCVLTRAKFFNNVIRPVLLPVSISDVCIPALHLDLGIYLYLYEAMLSDARVLDIKLAKEVAEVDGAGTNFTSLMETNKLLRESEQDLAKVQNAVTSAANQLSWLALRMDATAQNASTGVPISVPALIGSLQIQHKDLVSQQEQLTQKCQSLAAKVAEVKLVKDGPCSNSFESVLQKNNICRQHYHGGAFIGNHVRKALEPDVITQIVSAVPAVMEKLCPQSAELKEASTELADRYSCLFTQFSMCRQKYSSCSSVSDEDLLDLENKISQFLVTVRREIVSRGVGGITPKLHLLEDHVSQQMRHFGAGLGIFGEQGGEQLHAKYNNLLRTHANIPNAAERLLTVTKQHLISTLPAFQPLVPRAQRKRKRSQA